MTATLDRLEVERSSTFEEVVASFFPERQRSRAWRQAVPIGLILLVQALLTIRLTGSVSQDEALYINDGQYLIEHWLHGTPMQDKPSTYFSGAPALYPVLAGALDFAGGVTLVRLFSLLCMLGATVAVYSFGRSVFGERIGVIGALLFATAGPILFLGRFATFDAPTVFLLAVSAAWLARAVRRDSVWIGLAIGPVLVLASAVKYAGAVFLPGMLAVALVLGWRNGPGRAVLRVAAVIGSGVAVALPFVLLYGEMLRGSVTNTTTHRNPIAKEPALDLVRDIGGWVGPLIVLSVVGAVTLAVTGRRWLLAAALLGASLSADVYQVRLGEYVSLSKHVGFGLIFGAPLCAYGIVTLFQAMRRSRAWKVPAVFVGVAVLWVPLVAGVAVSRQMISGIPDAEHFVAPVVSAQFAADPDSMVLADFANVSRFVGRPAASFEQLKDTNYLVYEGQEGLPAFEAALQDHYFDLVVLDTEGTDISKQIDPLMRSWGYYLARSAPVWQYGTAEWHIWRLP